MFSYRRFFIVLLVVGAVSLPTVVAIDFFWKQTDKYAESILDTYNTRQTDVLYFGDSSVRFTGKKDKNTAGIDQLFQIKTGLSICTIANPGFSPVIYSKYIHLLEKTRYKPRLVVIPLNLRSFTGPAARRPAFDFPLRQLYIEYRQTGTLDVSNYLKYRFLGLEERLTESWKDQQVLYNGQNLGTHSSIQEYSCITEDLDTAPEREHLYAQQLGIKFRYHYMAPLDSGDTMFGFLDETIRYCKGHNIPVLFYLTPINFSDGKKYAGEDFADRVVQNIATIEKFLKGHDTELLNLAASLDESGFVDKRDVFEHYNFMGRDFIAKSVAGAAHLFFPDRQNQ